MEKKVLVIVVTYNGARWIRKCIQSVLDEGADIIMIDNASGDDTVALALSMLDSEHIVSTGANLGFGAANNIGLKYALEHGYDYVYLLNQDAYLTSGSLEALVKAHQKYPQCGIISPVQMDADGKVDANFQKKTHITGVSTEKDADIVEVPFVMAAHWLMPCDAVRKVGGFNPSFTHYGEDDNYVDRMHFHGFKVAVLRNVSGIHDRARRQSTKQQRCMRKCLIPVIRMSRPAKNWSFFRSVMWLGGCSMKNCSLIPVKSVGKLRKSKAQIIQNRELSKKEGAFLK